MFMPCIYKPYEIYLTLYLGYVRFSCACLRRVVVVVHTSAVSISCVVLDNVFRRSVILCCLCILRVVFVGMGGWGGVGICKE